MTFNTGYASLDDSNDFVMDGGKGSGMADRERVLENQEGIARILAENPADLYMLQELDKDSSRTFRENQLEVYGQVLPDCGWTYAPNFLCKFVPFPFHKPFGDVDSGVATYSRFAMEEPQRISLPTSFSWPMRVANLKRCMLVSRLPIEDEEAELVVINFHLEAYDSLEGKQAQTEQVLKIMAEEYARGNYVIAGGDFNQIFPEVVTDLKETSQWVPGDLEPLPGDWRYVYDDTTPTCRLLNQPCDPESPLTQYYVIDGFILSPNVQVQRIQTVNQHFEFSDHNPVILDLLLN